MFLPLLVTAQPWIKYPADKTKRGDLRVMFYNCENFFDTINDPHTRDDEFTPQGQRHWNSYKYWTKVYHVGKVIIAVGGVRPPEMVGLCEIENRRVLEDLTHKSPIKVFHYKIVHYESPDHRGIDVALLYLPQYIHVDTSYPIRVHFPPKLSTRPTRDILYVRVRDKWNDTLHVFVNHWPSRYGGHQATDPLRLFVARLVRRKADSILQLNPKANVLIMGDLNDYPTDISLSKGLGAKFDFSHPQLTQLYDLSYYLQVKKGMYSHKHGDVKGILDQMIVSGALLLGSDGLKTGRNFAHIYYSPFLLVKDPFYPGYKMFRTYQGTKYIGGYSDHLPAFLDLFHVKK